MNAGQELVHDIVVALDNLFPSLPPLAPLLERPAPRAQRPALPALTASTSPLSPAQLLQERYHLPKDAEHVFVGSVNDTTCVIWRWRGTWYGADAESRRKKIAGVRVAFGDEGQALYNAQQDIITALKLKLDEKK